MIYNATSGHDHVWNVQSHSGVSVGRGRVCVQRRSKHRHHLAAIRKNFQSPLQKFYNSTSGNDLKYYWWTCGYDLQYC